MTAPLLEQPSAEEQFYARALAVLAGPNRRMATLMRVCSLVYWLAVVGALAWLASQAIDRQPPVIIRSITLLTPKVAVGDPVRVDYALTRLRTCETDMTWSVYDGAGEIHRFGPVHVVAPGPPGQDQFVHAWTTPGDAAPGLGRLRVALAFSCPGNYLHAIYPVISILPDLPIEITAR